VRETAQVAIDRVGWTGRVAGPLLRLIFLAAAAVVAYLAMSLLDGPARADSEPAVADRPSVLGGLLNGVGRALSTVTGPLSTSDSSEPPGGARATDDHRATNDGRATDDRGASGDARTSGGTRAPESNRARGEPARRVDVPNAPKSSDRSGRATAPATISGPGTTTGPGATIRPGTTTGQAATTGPVDHTNAAGHAKAPVAARLGGVVQLVDALAPRAIDPSAGPLHGTVAVLDPVVATVVRSVRDVAVPIVVDVVNLSSRLVAPLTAPLMALSRAVIEPIAAVGEAVRDGVVVPIVGSSDGRLGALAPPLAATVGRAPPATPLPLPALAATGPPYGPQAHAGAAARSFTEYSPGVPGPAIRPDGSGGSGGVPVRQPSSPENAANGHTRAAGEGSPDRPVADGRSAWQPELAAGAVVSPAQTKRGGRSTEVDAPSG
jgi:hypothetical protein